jgi:hypothetical protein
MKHTLATAGLLPLCLGLFVLGFRLRGDENFAGPSSYDAIVAAPDNPKVVFENEKVRVLEVTIKPGEKEPFHEHSMFSVMTIFTGAPLRIMEATMKDGKLATVKTSWLTRITFNRRLSGCLRRGFIQPKMSVP